MNKYQIFLGIICLLICIWKLSLPHPITINREPKFPSLYRTAQEEQIDELHADMRSLLEKIEKLERDISNIDDNIDDVKSDISHLESTVILWSN